MILKDFYMKNSIEIVVISLLALDLIFEELWCLFAYEFPTAFSAYPFFSNLDIPFREANFLATVPSHLQQSAVRPWSQPRPRVMLGSFWGHARIC